MGGVLGAIERLVEWIGKGGAFLVLPATLLALMEVVLRYFFNAPTTWSNETGQFLFSGIFLLAAAYTLQTGGHVRVDIVHHYVPAIVRSLLLLLAYPIVAFYLAVFTWVTGERAVEAVSFLERLQSVWAPYVWPIYVLIPLASALMLLQLVCSLVREVRRFGRAS